MTDRRLSVGDCLGLPCCRALVAKAAEALFLLRILARNNLGRLTARLDAASVKTLTAMVRHENGLGL